MRREFIGIREAKTNLSKYLKMVGQGAEIIITDRGVPVGKLVPVQPEELSLDQRLKRLEEEGVIGRRPAGRKIEQPFPLAVPAGTARQLLQEERDHG